MEETYMNIKNDKSVHSRPSTNQRGPSSSERRFYRAVVLCLGLLSVFLLIGLICLSVHYCDSVCDAAAELSNIKANMTDRLQDSKNKQCSLTAEKDLLNTRLSSLSAEKDQLNSRLSSLTAEKDQLNSRLSSLTAEKDQLNSRLSSLTAEKDQLNSRLSSLTAEKNQLNTRLIEMTKDRDRLESLSKKTCPAGWTKFSWSCYILSSRSDSWTNGRRDCQNKGADLVIINSAEEQTFLSGLTKEAAWIGLTDRNKEGTWTWVDGTPLTFQYWDEGEPNDGVGYSTGGEDCGEIRVQKVHKWNDKPCELSLRWICEKKV